MEQFYFSLFKNFASFLKKMFRIVSSEAHVSPSCAISSRKKTGLLSVFFIFFLRKFCAFGFWACELREESLAVIVTQHPTQPGIAEDLAFRFARVVI